MATRSGSVDPGLLLWLIERTGMPEAELAASLEHESGMLGLAGSADMREVVARAESGDSEARLALDVYLHRLRGSIAAMAATLGGLDALVFTGGVGENNSRIRASAAAGLTFLGVGIDDRLNSAAGDREITAAAGTATRTLVIHAREDLEIATQVNRLLAGDPSA
jgi:acetate kinase